MDLQRILLGPYGSLKESYRILRNSTRIPQDSSGIPGDSSGALWAPQKNPTESSGIPLEFRRFLVGFQWNSAGFFWSPMGLQKNPLEFH